MRLSHDGLLAWEWLKYISEVYLHLVDRRKLRYSANTLARCMKALSDGPSCSLMRPSHMEDVHVIRHAPIQQWLVTCFQSSKKWERVQNTSSLVRQRRLLRVARRAECLSAHVFRIHSGYNINCRWVFKRRQDYATPGGLPSLVLVHWTSPRGLLTLDDSLHLWAFDELFDRTFEVDCIDVFGNTENATSCFIEYFSMPR